MTHARRGVRSEGPRYNTRLLRSRADLAFFFPASHNRSPVWESCQFARYLDRPFYITRRCPFTPPSGTIGLKDAIHLHRRSLVTPTKYPHARVKRIIIDWQLIIGGRVRRTSRELRALSSWNGNGKFSSFVARTSIFSIEFAIHSRRDLHELLYLRRDRESRGLVEEDIGRFA